MAGAEEEGALSIGEKTNSDMTTGYEPPTLKNNASRSRPLKKDHQETETHDY